MKKKIITIMLVLIMIIGNTITTMAYSHNHVYEKKGTYCTYSSLAYTHRYLADGKYRDCDVVQYYNHDLYECKYCDAYFYEKDRIDYRHMSNCGE